MDGGEGGLEGSAWGPVAVDAGDFAAGEDLADDEGAGVGLRHQKTTRIDVENLGSRRR